jgi:hypothetical protein
MTTAEGPDREALRDLIRDELAHWPIGSGYYSTTVGTDEARDMADAVLALLPTPPAPGLICRHGKTGEFGHFCDEWHLPTRPAPGDREGDPLAVDDDTLPCDECGADVTQDCRDDCPTLNPPEVVAARAVIDSLAGDAEGLRAEGPPGNATWRQQAEFWKQSAAEWRAKYRAALAARDTDQGARDALRALSEAATPGPWDAVPGAWGLSQDGPDHMRVVRAPHRNASEAIARLEYEAQGGADAEFIAAAANYVRAALAARDTDQGAGALGALVDRWRPITPTYHAVVAGEHLAACIACLMVAELDEVLPR